LVENLLRIVYALVATSSFSILLGAGLAIASRRLKVRSEERIESLISVLPGLNCGVCGYAGCELYAKALASETESDIAKCSPGGSDTQNSLAKLLGIDAGEVSTRMVARLACLGDSRVARKEFNYLGYYDCESAYSQFHGDKGCKYGCLGLGSCAKSCPVDAISYTGTGLVRVNAELCIGCEICVAVCPTAVMTMIPEDAKWFVACKSKDPPKLTKNLCRAGCIGCRICERKFPNSGFVVSDNLSVQIYNDDANEEEQKAASAACPPKCIISIC